MWVNCNTLEGIDRHLPPMSMFNKHSIISMMIPSLPGKGDIRSPIITDRDGGLHAIIPANHKLLLVATRTAKLPRQQIARGNFVLFKFYVDGEALSEGQLHEATLKAPHIHWAKAHIDTHPVEDQQRVEFAHQANAFVGTFVVKVFTKLRETKVLEQFTAVPEDGQVFEKTKRRICCALPPDAEGGDAGGSTGKVVRKFSTPESGLVETGLPVASLEVSYDDLVGTRARHWGQREFQVPRLREAGVGDILR